MSPERAAARAAVVAALLASARRLWTLGEIDAEAGALRRAWVRCRASTILEELAEEVGGG